MRLAAVLLAMLTGCEGFEMRGGSRPPPMLTCLQHLGECLDTPLGAIQGTYGQSVCVDCFDICQKDFFKTWPYFTGSFQSCRWWELGWILPPDAAPPEDAPHDD
jgi:hypothetical protein